ncbi:MAG: glycosyltransferase family 39 protein [Chitinophagaceae bacterium]|nr:glycosyltransferase family 39 protein [Chitinophagaceae bacterium]
MKSIANRPFLLFLPLLLVYALAAIVGHKATLEGDEGRYIMYAQNLLHGYYSPKQELLLWNGPGYPILLMPFVGLGLPMILPVILNAFFQYLSVVFLYKTIQLFARQKIALCFALIWGCYYVAFKELPALLTEPLANMLASLFLYYTFRAFQGEKKKAVLAGLIFGCLVLTKVIFGYILIAMLVLCLVAYLIKRNAAKATALRILFLALLVTLPYLFYTWSLTHRLFYWSNAGGMSLYWASSPVEGELGDWNDAHFTAYCGYDENTPCDSALFARNHRADYDSIYRYSGMARDDAFKQKALSNIRRYPVKYLKNSIANAGRLFFNLPCSYQPQRFQNLLRIPPGAAVLMLLVFSIIVSAVNLKQLPFVIWFITALIFFYLGASIAVSALQRYLGVIVPAIIVWAAWLFERTVRLRIHISSSE